MKTQFAFCVSMLAITGGCFLAREWSLINTEKPSGHQITAYTQGKVTEKNEAEWFKSTRGCQLGTGGKESPTGYDEKSLHHEDSQTEEQNVCRDIASLLGGFQALTHFNTCC